MTEVKLNNTTKFHLFFEQSGTFKNELKKLGYEASDYDILNGFGETDIIINLFVEIEKAYNNEPSIFDKIEDNDMVIAFFPCVRFSRQAILQYTCKNFGMSRWSNIKKLEYTMKHMDECNQLYTLLNKFVIICLTREIPCIIENPYGSQHYLTRYWCLKPNIIDMDRRKDGDYYKKPTQYFFIGCSPGYNNIEPCTIFPEEKIIEKERRVTRSLISPMYANRFLRKYVLSLREENKK